MKELIRPARFSSEDLVQPPPSALTVITTLADFAIISFAVQPAALARHLAPGFEPEVYTLSDGSKRALISAVTFRDLDFRFQTFPWAKFAFSQTNYRAYVLHRGRRVAWFFGTSLATPFVLIPRHVWQLPWHFAKMEFETSWTGELCTDYELTTTADWGAAQLSLEGTAECADCLDGFLDAEDCAVILTHPLIGCYKRRDGRIGSYSVWHDRLTMYRGVAKKAYFQIFEDLALYPPGTMPHSVIVQRKTEFTIVLPPKLVPRE